MIAVEDADLRRRPRVPKPSNSVTPRSRNDHSPGSIHFSSQLRGRTSSALRRLALLLSLPSPLGSNSESSCSQSSLSPCAAEEFNLLERPINVSAVLPSRVSLPRLATRPLVITSGTRRSRSCPSPPPEWQGHSAMSRVAGHIALASTHPALRELLGELLEQPQVGAPVGAMGRGCPVEPAGQHAHSYRKVTTLPGAVQQRCGPSTTWYPWTARSTSRLCTP
jgi:hypothetical protein